MSASWEEGGRHWAGNSKMRSNWTHQQEPPQPSLDPQPPCWVGSSNTQLDSEPWYGKHMALPWANNQLKRPINGDIWSSTKETVGSLPNHHKTSPTTCSELCSPPPSSTHAVSHGSPYRKACDMEDRWVLRGAGKQKLREEKNFWNLWWVSLGGKDITSMKQE